MLKFIKYNDNHYGIEKEVAKNDWDEMGVLNRKKGKWQFSPFAGYIFSEKDLKQIMDKIYELK